MRAHAAAMTGFGDNARTPTAAMTVLALHHLGVDCIGTGRRRSRYRRSRPTRRCHPQDHQREEPGAACCSACCSAVEPEGASPPAA
ncbi:hypothetical protein PVAP13_7NG206900 [Panicum virgatum]|uniref:Uncharacterized protein n=1 Tax=Panicum virgatum TaxID=38727 RepID=A0A8T0PYP7_PANVG|nr:hypothetical protein PVAP13_7NG206900 [Panicum virgatum]